MSVLKIKDQNGNWIQISTIKGEDGQDYVLTESDKQEIAGLVDAPVEDVQIDETSIINGGVAEIPKASYNNLGVVKTGNDYGIGSLSNGRITVYKADNTQIKSGEGIYRPIVPSNQHESAFYGLAKASGDTTQSQSDNEVGIYTDGAKASIQSMLGVPSEDDVITDVQVNDTSVVTNGVANIPVATSDNLGVVKTNSTYGVYATNGTLAINNASESDIKSGTNNAKPLTPNREHMSTFYGLAKAAGDTTQSQSNNEVGTYTDEAKTAIQSMLGVPSEDDVVTDVQINGTSIINNGVADIPIASSSEKGVVGIDPVNGIRLSGANNLIINAASISYIKAGTNVTYPIVSGHVHEATFYGLAKAAGDTTQPSSSNAVGQYTDEAKTAIKQMLDVKDDYDSLVVEVSGTDPIITGKPSYRYNCGELYTLSVTPPANGTMDIIFTSGTTPTVLSLPNTVKMPDWWAGIETNTTYEMCITDGTYCGVMSWAT